MSAASSSWPGGGSGLGLAIVEEVVAANVARIAKLPKLRDLGPELEVVDRLESEADKIYRRSVARLFSGELEAFEVLKLKDVVEVIEASINKIEKISDVVEAIAVKHA